MNGIFQGKLGKADLTSISRLPVIYAARPDAVNLFTVPALLFLERCDPQTVDPDPIDEHALPKAPAWLQNTLLRMAEHLNQVDGQWLLSLPEEARVRLVTAMSQAEHGMDVAGTLDEDLTALVAAAACGTVSGAFQLPCDAHDGDRFNNSSDSEVERSVGASSAKPASESSRPPGEPGNANSAKASGRQPPDPPKLDTSAPLAKFGFPVPLKRAVVQGRSGPGQGRSAGQKVQDRSGGQDVRERSGRQQVQERTGRQQVQERSGRQQVRDRAGQCQDRSARQQLRVDHFQGERSLAEATSPVELYKRIRALPEPVNTRERLRAFNRGSATPLPPLPCMLCEHGSNDTGHFYEHINVCHGGVQRYRHTILCKQSLSLCPEVSAMRLLAVSNEFQTCSGVFRDSI